MTLNTGKGNITAQSGNISQVLIAEQADFNTPISLSGGADASTANGFYRYQPRVNSMDIAAEGVTIPAVFFDGSAGQTKDAQGTFDIANGFGFGLSNNGSALFLRMLTQDKNPTWNIWGGSGQNIPAADTVVSSRALTDASTAATIADNLSTVTSPVQLVFTPANAATIASGQQATVTFAGTDSEDTDITETILYNENTAKNEATSRLWYKTVTAVTTAGWDEASGKTYTVTAQDTSAQVVFTPQDDELVAFWTAEVAKGLIPNVYDGLCMQSATIGITGRNDLIGFNCTFLGRNARTYTNLNGDMGSTARKTDFTTTGANRIGFASPDVYAGWQGVLTAENTNIEIALQELSLTINQELAYTNTTGSRFQGSPPVRDAKRLTQIESTIVFSPENDFNTYFDNNQILPNVNLTMRQAGYGNYPYELTFRIPEFQLTAKPDPSVTGFGAIPQTVVGKAVKGDRAIEYDILARYSDYPAVRVYT